MPGKSTCGVFRFLGGPLQSIRSIGSLTCVVAMAAGASARGMLPGIGTSLIERRLTSSRSTVSPIGLDPALIPP